MKQLFRTFISMLFILVIQTGFSQIGPLQKVWDKTFGGSGGDVPFAITSTTDGGYIVGGNSNSNIGSDKSDNSRGGPDYWIVKIDEQGNRLWDKTFGGSKGDLLSAIEPTADGGYILGGSSASDKGYDKSDNNRGIGSSDFWIIKIDAFGNKLWDKTYGGANDDQLKGICATSDGGYLLGGYSISNSSGEKSQDSKGYSDYWIIKIDAMGNKQWDKTIGGSEHDELARIKQTPDGGYILAGSSSSGISGDKSEILRGFIDYWVVKIDAAGIKQWDKTVGGSDADWLWAIEISKDGGYVVGGFSNSNAGFDKSENSKGYEDYWIVKLDNLGHKIWDRTYGGSYIDYLYCSAATDDGGYVFGGASWSNTSGDKSEHGLGFYDFWIVKINDEGDKLWDKTFGGDGLDMCEAIVTKSDYEYIFVGLSPSDKGGDKSEDSRGYNDYWLIKTTCNQSTFFKDTDGDGFGDKTHPITVCSATPPPGYVDDNTDCDDSRLLYADKDGDGYGAGVPVACGVADNTDCDDNDASVHSGQTFFKDADGDGFGDKNNSITVCSATPPSGYVTDNTDCDDSRLLYADKDGDGYGTGAPVACGVADNTDCDDNDASVHSGQTFFKDADGDGFGDKTHPITVCSATPPPGYVDDNTDCDDSRLLYADKDGDGYGAGAPVACGVADNTDCDDNDASVHSGQTFFKDADGDGFGDKAHPITVCSATPPSGYVTDNTDCDDSRLLYADKDGDGYGAGAPVACGVADNTDCDDNDASVHFGQTFFKDADGDGFGDKTHPITVCSATPPSGYVVDNTDCDDSKLLYADKDGDGYGAGSPVACGVADNTDCDDNDASVHSGQTFFKDADGDGFGDKTHPIIVCSATPPQGYVVDNTDCDDSRLLYADKDGDGYGAGAPVACGVADNTDCDDNDASVHSGQTFFKDTDGDGFGDKNNSITVCSATPPSGYVDDNTDCDDSKLLYADKDGDGYGAGVPVACGVADNTDCDDNDASVHSGQTFFKDGDGDGFGDKTHPITVCSATPPSGYVDDNTDCDDSKLLYADKDGDGYGAGAPVACGVADNTDCDDNDASVHSGQTFFKDADGDGFGDKNNSITVCSATPPPGYVADNTDCDDSKLLYADKDGDGYGTGAPIACGVADNTDCDDNDASVHSGQTFFKDADGDGFGDKTHAITVCSATPPSGYVVDNTDCDDSRLLYADKDGDGYGAGAPVACGVADNTDCDDNDASVHSGQTFFKDADGDGFGDKTHPIIVCSATPPPGYVTDNTDCDDSRLLYADKDGDGYGAGVPVACGVADNTDCDDNDASVHSGQTFFKDADGDGFGDKTHPITVCSATPPSGYVADNTDCDDSNASVHPGASELCGNGRDDNCNGSADEGCNNISGNMIPNAFTPNGDGLNDIFRIPVGALKKLDSFTIFDHYGKPVFITADISKGWDGTVNYYPAKTGTYVYIIKGINNNNASVTLKGTVVLIR